MAGETILIVEDEGILAAHLQYVLTELGYHPVGPKASGAEAISAAEALKPDLILFNNQLQAVIGYIDIASHGLPRDSSATEALIQALKAANRAAEVSRLMLIYLGQTPTKQEPMHMGEVCRWSLPLLRAILPETISLITDFAFPGPTILGNTNQIQQILTNLVTNAREAIGDNPGDIHLIVKTVSASEIPMANCFPVNWEKEAARYVCLEVADSGCGVTETNIEKIFDPFFTSKFTGRGLGLSVVLGIARSHRGVVAVKSKSGRGSSFRVFFPIPAPQKVMLPMVQE